MGRGVRLSISVFGLYLVPLDQCAFFLIWRLNFSALGFRAYGLWVGGFGFRETLRRTTCSQQIQHVVVFQPRTRTKPSGVFGLLPAFGFRAECVGFVKSSGARGLLLSRLSLRGARALQRRAPCAGAHHFRHCDKRGLKVETLSKCINAGETL